MELRTADIPSMNNYYNSTNWENIKNRDLSFNSKLNNLNYSNGEQSNFADVEESFISLTGEKMDINNLKHNNMQKFIKNGVTQNINTDNYIIDNNSEVHKLYNNKKEIENFFQPQKGINNISGANFNSNFLKNRTVNTLSQISNNVFPIDKIRVGPGINDGYNNKGSGGFHNFYTNIHSKEKNIDDLRTKTNQKMRTFKNNYRAPEIKTSQRGIVSSFNKNKPETVFKTNKNNWFKTTGANLKESKRSIENVKDTNKQNSHIEYSGGIKYIKPGIGNEDQYGKDTIIVYDNERQTTESKTAITNITSVVKAVIAPIIDGIKFSTKEYMVDSARETGGNIRGLVEKATTYDPVNHIAKTTVKETTIHDNENANLKGPNNGYTPSQDIAKTTVKETTIHDNENANLKGPNNGYTASQDIAKTTVKETTIHDNNIGNLKGNTNETYVPFDDKAKTTVKETSSSLLKDNFRNIGPVVYKTYVYDPELVAKTTVKETTIKGKSEYGFLGGILNKMIGAYSNKKIKLNNTNKEFTSQVSTTGNVSSIQDHRTGFRKQYYNAPQDDTRERILIAAGHTPNPGNMNLNIDSKDVNISVNKNELNVEDYGNVAKIYQNQPSVNFFRDSITKDNLQVNAYKDRLDASLMKSLKANELNIGINPIPA